MKEIMRFLERPIYAYSRVRGLHYWLQYAALDGLSKAVIGQAGNIRKGDSRRILESAEALLREDAHQIASGAWPLSVLTPESPLEHWKRFPLILWDGIWVRRRRTKGKSAQFSVEASALLEELPRYYRRNFHFQTDGYLSRKSAELYEHQVELLFGGMAGAMRRALLGPMIEHFRGSDGAGLIFLETGAGTGPASRFVRRVFPKAKIVISDLSEPYLKVAAKKCERFSKMDFVQADAASLPFQDAHFDAVYSVFLFHELPLDAREQVLAEGKRVLKEGGFFGLVDSVQTGDSETFDPVLESFPKDFHEPFYKNYIEHPMEKLLAEAHFEEVRTKLAFSSKVCWARKSLG